MLLHWSTRTALSNYPTFLVLNTYTSTVFYLSDLGQSSLSSLKNSVKTANSLLRSSLIYGEAEKQRSETGAKEAPKG